MSFAGDLAAFVAELPVSSRAAARAATAHAGQVRQADGAPFVLHPFEVARHLLVPALAWLRPADAPVRIAS